MVLARVLISRYLTSSRTKYRTAVELPKSKDDIEYVKQLMESQKEDSIVAKMAISKILNHLWYLSEALVGLSFFNESIDGDEKEKMVKNLGIRSN